MWSIGIVCLLLSLVVQLSLDVWHAEAVEEDLSLRVSIRQDALQGVSSCVHAFSQVELLNLSPSDPIVIHSVSTTQEDIVVVKSRDDELQPDKFPQQIHVAQVNELSVGPKQIAIVPLTFLPRFPEMASPDPSASPTESPRRSNIGYETNDDSFEVHTDVMLDTSRGLLKMSLSATSVRENGYGLPDVIHFRENGGWEDTGGGPSVVVMNSDDWKSIFEMQGGDCFDVHLSNPSERNDLQILDVFLSRPDLVSILHKEMDTSDAALTQMFKEWDDDGQRSLAPGVTGEYLLTLCNVPSKHARDPERKGNVDTNSELNSGLGYLQVRTDDKVLVVNLEQQTVDPIDKNVNSSEGEDPPESVPDGTVVTFSEQSSAIAVPVPSKVSIRLMPTVTESYIGNIEFQNTSPHKVRFTQLSLVTPFVNDTALHEQAIKVGLVMEAKVGKRCCTTDFSNPFEQRMLEETVLLSCSISPKPTLGDSLRLGRPYRFTGSVIVRTAYDIQTTCDDWKDNDPHSTANLTIEVPYEVIVTDPRLNLVLDSSSEVSPLWKQEKTIPSGVKLLEGLFFPLRRTEGRLTEDTNTTLRSRDKGFTYTLHVVSPVKRTIGSSDIELLDPPAQNEKWRDGLCKRFKITSFEPSPTALRLGASSLYDLGTITLSYNMDKVPEPKSERNRFVGKAGVQVDDEFVYPHVCHLSVKPKDALELQIPLILVTGKLDVSASEFAGQETPAWDGPRFVNVREGFSPSLHAGLEKVIRWLRNSEMGPPLKKMLKNIFSGTKSVDTSDGAVMLAKYLADLLPAAASAFSSLRPILLNLGAVVHSEVHSSSLSFTNYNPVPVKVYIDVGEVEGMSIALARDFSHAKGDGNSLLDSLPGIDEVEDKVITTGRWKGHSKRGLHQLLLTSESAQAFSASLRYRDDVSLGTASVYVEPLLESMYDEKDVAHFHADPIPPNLQASEDSACPGHDLHPPEYSSVFQNGTNSVRPFIMTDSPPRARHLNICRGVNGTVDSTGSTTSDTATQPRQDHILIPPGGVARFEVKVRCPPMSALESDITRFLSTGLVLSTNYGQIMPIIVTFEALLGHLQISHDGPSKGNATSDAVDDDNGEATVDVPAGLFVSSPHQGSHEPREGIVIPPREPKTHFDSVGVSFSGTEDASIPLIVTSSFTRNVTLREVDSCNPWFEVRLREDDEAWAADDSEGTAIGTIHSVIPCKPFHDDGRHEFHIDFPRNYPYFPSFYDCALDWLQRRLDLQPRGCGEARVPGDGWNEGENTENDAQSAAVEALTKAVHFSLLTFNEGIPKSDSKESASSFSNTTTSVSLQTQVSTNENVQSPLANKNSLPSKESPFIRHIIADVFAQVNDAWRLVTESGLNVLSSNLRAKINYGRIDASDSNKKKAKREAQTLSVAMNDVALRTSLEMPKLVDYNRSDSSLSQAPDLAEPAVLQFPPTRVAEVTSLKVPVRNPTGVPVRVRLAAVGKSDREGDKEVSELLGFTLSDTAVRERYFKHYNTAYIQNGNVKDKLKDDSHGWWEGGGAYIMPNDRGDLIQARYNLSITAGPGAHISLVNPSLHAFNGLLMACGTRCGVNDEVGSANAKQAGSINHESNQPLVKSYSPIGASSAAGMTLLGHPRPSRTPLDSKRHFIAAGGSMPADWPHLPFAIPYESLGEIVLPPYGTGELGPILFRPPGRYDVLGCGTAFESQSIYTDETTETSCESKAFESVIFIENSLTGLERLVLHGKGTWERIVFLDPKKPESSIESFGDLEYRYGRSALVFPGSATSDSSLEEATRRSESTPVRKEVVVHNEGDTTVSFGGVYFSHASNLHFASRIGVRKARRTSVEAEAREEKEASCHLRGFRLLGCADTDALYLEHSGQRVKNIRHGFQLSPGQNLTLSIEHYPDCAYDSEFVTLNFAYGDETQNDTSWTAVSSRSRHRIGIGTDTVLENRKLELLVGFDMSADQMASCVPVTSAVRSSAEGSMWWQGQRCPPRSVLSSVNDTEAHECQLQEVGLGFVQWTFFSAARMILLCSSALIVCYVVEEHKLRRRAFAFFRSHLRSMSAPGQSSLCESDWSAAFRCLARADPLSSELQALSREQARQLVLNRYKSIGAISPQCVSSAGVFLRDRAGVAVGGSRGGAVLAGSEKRVLTVSDAMFKEAFTDQAAFDNTPLVPSSLGWRAAVAKGVLRKASLVPDVEMKSRAILLERRKSMEAAGFVSVDEEVQSEASSDVESDVVEDEEEDEVVTEEAVVSAESDEQKGDVISTSESEGTTGALKDEVEATLDEEAELPGFSKVGVQKGKSGSRQKVKKKASETEPQTKQVERPKVKGRKDIQNDIARVSKQQLDTRVKSQATSQKVLRERERRTQDTKVATSNIVTKQRTRGQVAKIKPLEKKADGARELAKAKVKKAKSKQPAVVPPRPPNKIGANSSPVVTKSTPSSVNSSPSSVGQASSKSNQLDAKRPGLRPPPGLAPPPGFAGDKSEPIRRVGSNEFPPLVPSLAQAEPALAGSDDLTSAVTGVPLTGTSPVLESAPAPTSSFFTSILTEDTPAEPSAPVVAPSEPSITSVKREDPQARTDSGFDVLDFLDGILEDRNSMETEEEGLGDLLEETTSGGIAPVTVSSNPWATERKSRAAAYGINVEDDNDDDGDYEKTDDIVYAILASATSTNLGANGEANLQATVPLLTPAAMLTADDESEDRTPGLFNRSSFYSSLLEE